MNEANTDTKEIGNIIDACINKDAASQIKTLLNGANPDFKADFIREVSRRLNLSGSDEEFISQNHPAYEVALSLFELKEITADKAINSKFVEINSAGESSETSLADLLVKRERVHPTDPEQLTECRLAQTALADSTDNLQAKHAFGLFLPDNPDRPEIVVYTALSRTKDGKDADLSGGIEYMRSADNETHDNNNHSPDTIVFYSISNIATPATRRIQLGKELIERIALNITGESKAGSDEIKPAVPHLENVETLTTLSPMTGFNEWAVDRLNDDPANPQLAPHLEVISEYFTVETKTKGKKGIDLLDPKSEDLKGNERLEEALTQLGLEYLQTTIENDGKHNPVNLVAKFHVASNGAKLSNFHPLVDLSENGMDDSLGCMVNYRYNLKEIEQNKEDMTKNGNMPISDHIQNMLPPNTPVQGGEHLTQAGNARPPEGKSLHG